MDQERTDTIDEWIDQDSPFSGESILPAKPLFRAARYFCANGKLLKKVAFLERF